MKLMVSVQSDVGLKRENNQDSFLVDDNLGIYVVADGMGGHQGGEVASRLAADSMKQVVSDCVRGKTELTPEQILQKAYSYASGEIYSKSEQIPELKGMGTTAVSALFRNGKVFIGNVGDSRAYLIHPPYIWQITEDHSLVNEQLKAGLIKPDQIPVFTAKNIITRSVGFESDVDCDIIEREVEDGDCLLLCSDGLTGVVSDRRICDVALTMPFKDVVPRLIEEANRAGGDDNITVIFIKVTH